MQYKPAAEQCRFCNVHSIIVPAAFPQSTFARFGEALGGGAFPGLDPSVLRTIRKDLVTTAAAVSGGSWNVACGAGQ